MTNKRVRLARLLRAIGATIGLVAVLLVVAPPPIGGHLGVAIVRGSSMQPLYNTGDMVITLRGAAYQPGEIILYESGQGRVIHRVVSGDHASGYITQGDNRAVVDEWVPEGNALIGRAVLHVPAVGRVVQAVQDVLGPRGLVALAVLTALLATRPKRRAQRRAWRDGSREVALAAAASGIAALAVLVLAMRMPDGAWALPISRTAAVRMLIATAGLAAQVAVVALAVGRNAHVRLRTLALDLALGSRVVDVTEIDTAGRAVGFATGPRDLRRAADRAGLPVLRVRLDDGRSAYHVIGADLALVLDSAPALAGRPALDANPAS